MRVNDANVVTTDIECTNGVIHVIDAVILPPKKAAGAAALRGKIEQAIARGVPAFNAGHHCECAHYYTSTIMELVMDHTADLPADVRTDLADTLRKSRHTDSATDRAWLLRRAMDRAYQAM